MEQWAYPDPVPLTVPEAHLPSDQKSSHLFSPCPQVHWGPPPPALPGPAQLHTLGEGRRGPLARGGGGDQKGYHIIAMPPLEGLESQNHSLVSWPPHLCPQQAGLDSHHSLLRPCPSSAPSSPGCSLAFFPSCHSLCLLCSSWGWGHGRTNQPSPLQHPVVNSLSLTLILAFRVGPRALTQDCRPPSHLK